MWGEGTVAASEGFGVEGPDSIDWVKLRVGVAALILLGACAPPGETANTAASTTTTETSVPSGWEQAGDPAIALVRSSNSSQNPAAAVDDSEDTSWSPLPAPQWIEIDLGQPELVATLRMVLEEVPMGSSVHEVTAGAHERPGMSIVTIRVDADTDRVIEVAINKEVRFIRVTTPESASSIAWVEIDVIPAG